MSRGIYQFQAPWKNIIPQRMDYGSTQEGSDSILLIDEGNRH